MMSWAKSMHRILQLMPVLFICFPGPLSGAGPGGSAGVQTIFAVGDIMLSGSAGPLYFEKGYDYPFQDKELARLIASSDIAFGNLEYPITRKGIRYRDKKYVFRGPPESLGAIRKAGFNLLSLANNHIMDYGEKGLADTILQCRKQKFAFAGAGENLPLASSYAVLEKNGVKYGLLAYSFTFPDAYWATADKPGTAHPEWAQLESDIMAARQDVDILIVSCHWGEELKSDPKKYQVDFAHHAVRSGADLVLGHHPHVPQAIEVYRGKPVFYSLGNYAFGTSSSNVKVGFAAAIRFEEKVPVRITLYPVNVCNRETGFIPRLARGTLADHIIMHLGDISRSFGTTIECRKGKGTISVQPYRPEPPVIPAEQDMTTTLRTQEYKE
jgi:poly-gamma-glutamate capsule biosynthesis protein CapA/YwtB (metallophosphatase superfamily)